MATCPRGFLMVRNMRTGAVVPFFIKVREQDIIWESDVAALNAVAAYSEIDDTWDYDVDTTTNRVEMFKVLSITDLTFVSTRKATLTITLPVSVNATTSGTFITKESNDTTVLENTMVEGRFINSDDSGLSNILQITFISVNGEFTSSNVTNLSGNLNILVRGFSVEKVTFFLLLLIFILFFFV